MSARLVVVALGALLAARVAFAQEPVSVPVGTIHGTVLDARTGHPVGRVEIRLSDTPYATASDDQGRFRVERIPPGDYVLVASVVGYTLIRRAVTVRADEETPLEILLTEGVGTYEERIDVVAPLFERTEPGTVGETTIGSAELLNLRGLVADDPLRAVQAMPGVAASDDFTAEFSVRGSRPRDIGIVLDGVPASAVLRHSVEGRDDSGSIARINSDVLERATMLLGSYPQRYGGRLGAQLELATRQGSRDRVHVRGVASTVTAAVVAEGPLRGGRGAWLTSLRQSYLDWVIRSLDEDNTSWLNFTDGLARVDLDLSSRHRVSLLASGGRSHYEEKDDNPGVNSLRDATTAGGLVLAGLRSQSQSWLVHQRAFAMVNRSTNAREDGAELGSSRRTGIGYRVDAATGLGTRATLEVGADVRRLAERQAVWVYDRRRPNERVASEQVDEAWSEGGAFGQISWRPGSRTSLVAGARVDANTLTHEIAPSPWAQVRQALPGGLALTAGTGIFRQLPLPAEYSGVHGGGEALGLSHAWHADAGLEGTLGGRARWQINAFLRNESGVVWAEGLEPRRVGNAVVVPRPFASFENRLDGTSRGVEIVLHRRDANRVSGWIAYAYARTRYRDVKTGEAFDGDWDQRHTLNVYGSLRITSKTMGVARYVYGSNRPLNGYYQETGQFDAEGLPVYAPGTARNTARLPVYSRLDLRVNQAFNLGTRRLTLFVELINVMGRTNAGPSGGRRVEKLLPFIPAAGCLFEF